ncbi:MAG TPA: glycosyltransferase family 2 protein [Acidisarcina sp.]
MPTISIIIPAYNAQTTLRPVLEAICSQQSLAEVVVVDDGSTDGTAAICAEFPVKLLSLPRNAGPAHARNVGARAATGELLLFLDADTCLAAGGLERIAAAFAADPGLDGLIGAYDDQPAAPGLIPAYRNLLHCYIHRNARHDASTFWSGCGVIRAELFRQAGGFDESYRRASIEDLELGYRLHRGGARIVMDPALEVKHLKRWTLRSMLVCDVRDRGVPWTQLILRQRFMPADLNLGLTQRLSVAGVFGGVLLLAGTPRAPDGRRLEMLAGAAVLLSAVLAINRGFYSFLYRRRGLRFTAGAAGLHLLFYFYNGVSFLVGLGCWALKSHPIRALRRRVSAMDAR